MERTHQVHVDIAIVLPGSERHDMKLKHIRHTGRHLPPPPSSSTKGPWTRTVNVRFHLRLGNALGMGVKPSKNRKTQGWRDLGLAVLGRKSGLGDRAEKQVADAAGDDR